MRSSVNEIRGVVPGTMRRGLGSAGATVPRRTAREQRDDDQRCRNMRPAGTHGRLLRSDEVKPSAETSPIISAKLPE
jgi:hypothetical protein